MSFGETLRNLIADRGMNINQFAKICGIPPTTLYSIIKRDSSQISYDVIVPIAHSLGIDPQQLAGWSDGYSAYVEIAKSGILDDPAENNLSPDQLEQYIKTGYDKKSKPATKQGDGLTAKERAVALAYRAASDDDKAVVDVVLKKYTEQQREYISEQAT